MATTKHTRGGKKLKRFIRSARAAQASRVKSIEVGLFSDDRYPNGTPVPIVGAWHEFGTGRGTPERPAFRNALPDVWTARASS